MDEEEPTDSFSSSEETAVDNIDSLYNYDHVPSDVHHSEQKVRLVSLGWCCSGLLRALNTSSRASCCACVSVVAAVAAALSREKSRPMRSHGEPCLHNCHFTGTALGRPSVGLDEGGLARTSKLVSAGQLTLLFCRCALLQRQRRRSPCTRPRGILTRSSLSPPPSRTPRQKGPLTPPPASPPARTVPRLNCSNA
jgi:hypothetical protein